MVSYLWKNNDTIIYLQDTGGDENYHVFICDLLTESVIDATPFKGINTQIIHHLPHDSEHIIIATNQRSLELFDCYRLHIHTHKLTMIAENKGAITDWTCDHLGQVRIGIQTDGVNTSILYKEYNTDDFTLLLSTDFRNTFKPIVFHQDNKRIYVSSNIGQDKSQIYLIDPDRLDHKELIYAHEEVDIWSIKWSDKRQCMTGVEYTTDKTYVYYTDEYMQEIYTAVRILLPDDILQVRSMDDSETKIIFMNIGDRNRGKMYLYDTANKSLLLLSNLAPWLNPEHLCEMQYIQYTSRDGLTIPGYLTLPKNNTTQKLPVVINPHGGPWHRDVWGFNPELQFMASRGYAVLQMNYRGSIGYGRSFWESSFKQWGGTMQDDISDGVQWLIDRGTADPERIAIYGVSYGGYATLAGITFTPDLYACAIDYVGVSNLFTFLETIPPYWKPYLEMMYAMIGDPIEDKSLLIERSPVFHVDKIRCPLLVAQGANDPRVKKSESDQIVKALEDRGIQVEYIVKSNEGHGFNNEENRFEFYLALETFLNKYIGKIRVINDKVLKK